MNIDRCPDSIHLGPGDSVQIAQTPKGKIVILIERTNGIKEWSYDAHFHYCALSPDVDSSRKSGGGRGSNGGRRGAKSPTDGRRC